MINWQSSCIEGGKNICNSGEGTDTKSLFMGKMGAPYRRTIADVEFKGPDVSVELKGPDGSYEFKIAENVKSRHNEEMKMRNAIMALGAVFMTLRLPEEPLTDVFLPPDRQPVLDKLDDKGQTAEASGRQHKQDSTKHLPSKRHSRKKQDSRHIPPLHYSHSGGKATSHHSSSSKKMG